MNSLMTYNLYKKVHPTHICQELTFCATHIMAYTGNERNVVILGKVGSGKKTLGNHIAGGETALFHRERGRLGTRNVSTYYGERTREGRLYRILTIDTESLQTRFNNPIQHIREKRSFSTTL